MKHLYVTLDYSRFGVIPYTNQINKCKTIDSFYHTTINMAI